MESVPVTTQLPPSPQHTAPTLLLHESSPLTSSHHIPNFSHPAPSPQKPSYTRRVTEPSFPVLPWDTSRHPLNPPGTSSPFNRGHGHIRSQSLAAPQMSRAKSMPGAPSFASSTFTFGIQRPSSPAGASSSPHRQRAMRKPADEAFPSRALSLRLSSLDLGRLDTGAGIGNAIIAENQSSIPEEAEEAGDFKQRSETGERDADSQIPILAAPRSASPSLYPGYAAGAYTRQRRPNSPLRNYNYASSSSSMYSSGTGATTPTSPSSIASSPSPLYACSGAGGRYEALSGYNFPPSVSSNPTTPSSLRSRSPSISSLETIPDSPDAEEAAVEAERVARRLRKQQQREEDEGGSGSGSEGESGKRGRRSGSVVAGASASGRDKSKRWSVCGAERRQDLDLETIWED